MKDLITSTKSLMGLVPVDAINLVFALETTNFIQGSSYLVSPLV